MENARLLGQFYAGWRIRVYWYDIPGQVQIALQRLGAELVAIADLPRIADNMIYRFLVNDDHTVTKYVVRDADSRPSERERIAVQAWLASDKPFHIMRDHLCHGCPIMGGMWGGTTGYFNIGELISDFTHNNNYGNDQHFLAERVYPIIRDQALIHDSNDALHDFPRARLDPEDYVGRRVYVDEEWDRYCQKLFE